MTVSEIFSAHINDLNWDDIETSARYSATLFLHDSICVGVAGSQAPYSDNIAAVAALWGEPRQWPCLVLGRPNLRLPAASAAFVNAFQIHGQEFDCVHESAVVHPLATIVAVLLADAQQYGPVSGRDFMTALCAGVDISVALGLAATSPLRFFRPATAGIFGCVAAVAKLRRLSPSVTTHALGYALAFAGGTMQAHVEGLPTLPIQIAAAARSAIQAVDIAQAGLPGPLAAIEGPFGYLSLFEESSDLEPVLADLASRRRISEVSWKPFPTGRAAHGGIVATQDLMADSGVTVENLSRLIYRAPPLIHRLVGRPAREGMTPAYARLCFPYLASLVLRFGSVRLQDFSTHRLHDPTTLELAGRISVEVNHVRDPAAFTPAVAEAHLTTGATVRVDVTAQLGSPERPLTLEQHHAKARQCLSFAGLERCADRLADAVFNLDRSDDVAATIASAFR